MATYNHLSEELNITIPFHNLDIGGTDTAHAAGGTPAENHWVSMSGQERFLGFLYLAAVDAADNVSALTLEQATDSVGAGGKALLAISDATGIDAAGETGVLEIHASKMDAQNAFNFVRMVCTFTLNTGADEVTGIYIRSSAMHQKAGLTTGTASAQGN